MERAELSSSSFFSFTFLTKHLHLARYNKARSKFSIREYGMRDNLTEKQKGFFYIKIILSLSLKTLIFLLNDMSLMKF